jgi:hypothetical protein
MPEVLAAPGADQERGRETPNVFDVFVSYNGLEKQFTVNVNEPVHVLLSKAIREFGVTNQPHILSLFNQANVELPDAAKLGEVGVKQGEHLLMRPSAVKGG